MTTFINSRSELQAGDVVRVTYVYEGTVDLTRRTVQRANGRGEFYLDGYEEARTIELLSRPTKPANVGDIIEGKDAYKALPVGAVVRGYDHELGRLVRLGDGWRYVANGRPIADGWLFAPRTLVYLP